MCRKSFAYTKKFYVQKNVYVNLSKIYLPKKAKKTWKPNNHDLNRVGIINTNYIC